MSDAARARRLADRIQRVVAETLERGVKDPRLGFVTVTGVRLTPDLREAIVYYTVLGDETERAASAAALDSARGVLRAEVGRRTGVRFTPSLAFVADTVPQTAARIDELLDAARRADAAVASAAAGAAPAGDPRPYRTAGQEEDPTP